jgi:hypothetical protein
VPGPLPLLLAGPILRRATPTSISVWVATSQACTVRLDAYNSPSFLTRSGDAQTGTVGGTSAGTASHDTVRVGAALHVAVATAPLAGIPPNTQCSYNVTLDVAGPASEAPGWSGSWDLGGLKLLDQGNPTADYMGGLGYAPGQLPCFVTPPDDVTHLRLVHGSCFKMHGVGPSVFAALDDILSDSAKSTLTQPDGRPHLVIFTGDQIYADEVASAMSPALTAIGARLLGVTETVPLAGAPDGQLPVTQDALPAGRRQKLVRVQGGLSSQAADSHVIGLGEFAALYILSWTGSTDTRVAGSDALWPAKLAVLPDDHCGETDVTGVPVALDPTEDTISPIHDLLTPVFGTDGAGILQDLRKNFRGERAAVGKIRDDGDKVRRALANIPMLTICDDHEVTDDWFITGAWRARVLGSNFGRAIVRNALVAYVLFQAWGNTPDAFGTAGTPEAQLLQLIPQLFASGGTPDPSVCSQIDGLLGLTDTTGTGSTPRVTFNYHLDLAGGRLLVLDTRTHREYATPDGPPGLLTSAALDSQLPISLTDDVPWMIVVSPAPVLGPRLIEEVFSPLVARAYDVYHLAMRKAAEAAAGGFDTHKPFGDLWLDVEAWSSRPQAFERFLARLTRCPSVVVLAGDVHYAASYTMDYQRFVVATVDGGVPSSDPPPRSATGRLVHFTSSAVRNAWMPAVATFARSIAIAENLERLGMAGARLGWNRVTPPVLTGGDIAAGEARPLRARLRREPVVLPTAGWHQSHPIRHPEWAYVVSPIFDTRTDDVRFADLATQGFTDVLGPSVPDAPPPPPDGGSADWTSDPNGPYSTATRIHADNVNGAAVTRGIVFANNVGRVSFSRAGDGSLSVTMAVRFVRSHPARDDEKPHDYVVHSAALTPVPYAAPDHVGGA